MARTRGLNGLVAAADRLLPDGDVVVALGGGADSATAALVTVRAGRRVLGVFVAHATASTSLLGEATRRLADRLGIEHLEVPAPVDAGGDLERRLREARRAALREVAAGRPIVLGHTADDQAETVLLHLFRGAGVRGLAGMRRADPPWYRPLLDLSRAEARRLAEAAELPFVDDPMNDDPRFSRNRLRRRLLPIVEGEVGPVTGVLAATADRLAEVDRHLAAAADAVPLRRDAGALLLPAPVLVAVEPAVAAYAVWRALLGHLGPQGGTAADVAAVLEVARDGGRRQLGGGFLAEREGPHVAIHRGGPEPPEGEVELPVPGRCAFGPFTVAAEPGPRGRFAPPPGPLRLRVPRPGDRIPIREGRKTVADALAEAGVPRRLRGAWPVVVAGSSIVAIPGVRLAPQVATRPGSGLELTIERRP